MIWECKSRQTSKQSPVLEASANLRLDFNFSSMQAIREKDQGPPEMSFCSSFLHKVDPRKTRPVFILADNRKRGNTLQLIYRTIIPLIANSDQIGSKVVSHACLCV